MNEADDTILDFTVSDAETGQRLDRFLTEHCPDFSRSQIQNSFPAELVQVDGQNRPKGFKLKAGSRVRFTPPPQTEIDAVPQEIPLNIIYEDEHILVVDKQHDLVVHPAPGHPDGTLVNGLLYHCTHLAEGTNALRPGIVHRLDRGTTGLLVVALNDRSHRSLADQLRQRTMGRIYQALSWGHWPEDTGTLTGAIGRHPKQRQKMTVVDSGGRSAQTKYQVSEDYGFCQLCRVELQTGRTHQIRVHFAHAGRPIVGDPMYGNDRRARNVRPVERPLAATMMSRVDRQMLHAAQLHLEHPNSGQRLEFTATLPEDMALVINGLRAGSGYGPKV